MKTANFNSEARKQLKAICHQHDLDCTDMKGSTQGLIKQKTLDNFAIEYSLTVDGAKIIENGAERPATRSECWASAKKIETACDCKMIPLEDDLDYLYRVVFYNEEKPKPERRNGMKFEKYLFGIELNKNQIAKYNDGEKIFLAHERSGKTIKSVSFASEEKYETAIDSALIDENDGIYNKSRALGAILDKFFDTNMLG